VPYRRGRCRRRCGVALAACAVGLALGALAACGLKTPPRPLSEVLPPTAGLRAWQREAEVLVTWQLPEPAQQERFRGLRGFVLTVQERPELCPDCPPGPQREIALGAEAPALQRQGARVFYVLPFPAHAGRMSVGVRTRFGLGLGPAGALVAVERAGEIPVPALAWRWSGSSEAAGARSVQFYWEARQERIVQVIGTDGQPRERVQFYGANLYRRVVPGPWPPLPLNAVPLQGASWIVPPLQAEFPKEATGEAYQLRFVDQFGNEGAASAEVLIPLSGRRP
jgi:hypothetical protein